jgi:hypothetical protein
MSTKATIFLTKDDEHCYREFCYSVNDGESIIMEANRENVKVIETDYGYQIEFVKPASDIYKQIHGLIKNK